MAASATLAQPRPAAAEALLLVDAESGKVLFAENATRCFPRSGVTKLGNEHRGKRRNKVIGENNGFHRF